MVIIQLKPKQCDNSDGHEDKEQNTIEWFYPPPHFLTFFSTLTEASSHITSYENQYAHVLECSPPVDVWSFFNSLSTLLRTTLNHIFALVRSKQPDEKRKTLWATQYFSSGMTAVDWRTKQVIQGWEFLLVN